MQESPIILFDGVCNLCNGAVQFVIRHDPQAIFKFASLQSETGQEMLRKFGLPASSFDSFVLIDNGKAYTKSDAALAVVKKLPGMLRFLYGLKIVPAILRDAVYNLVAKKRYGWFGKKDSCMIPTKSIQHRFI